MRSIPWVGLVGLVFVAGCRKAVINQSSGVLAFSCPTDAVALTIQNGSVLLDFGEVPIGQTTMLDVDITSLSGTGVTVTSVDAAQGSSPFSFPLSVDTAIQPAPPTLVRATFTSLVGVQSASWKLGFASGPPVTITLQGTGFPVRLAVNPIPIDFGDVEVHTSSIREVTVTNRSAQAIDLGLSLPDAGPFSVSFLSSRHVEAGASGTLRATYSPTQAEDDVSLVWLTGCGGCSAAGVQLPLKGMGVRSALTYPNPLSFGFVVPTTSVNKILVLRNLGSQSIVIPAQPSLYAGTFVAPVGSPPVYGFTGPSMKFPYSLPGGGELDLPITFTPPQLGAYLDANVTFSSSDSAASQVLVALQGYGGGAQISCQPGVLDLGPTALGFTSTQSILCLNAGTNVPGFPQAALQLSQNQLSSNSPDFSASLEGTDGGSTLSLAAGQSATIQVGFTPSNSGNGGEEAATLQIGSNDVAHDPLSIPMTGRGIIPGPCNDVIVPAGGLDFGEVSAANSALLQFAVQNEGNNYCILDNLSLATGSDSAFSLPNGPAAYQLLSFLGDPNNTTHLPIEYRVAVQFAPTTSKTAVTGNVAFRIPNGTPVYQDVHLTGSSAPACLKFSPSRLDFGRVGFSTSTGNLCFSPHQNITVENSCGSQVVIQTISLNVELDDTPQFTLSGLPVLPATLAAGDELTFTATLVASQSGPTEETVQLRTSETFTTYNLSLTGDAEAMGSRSESFIVPLKELDLVLILDVDDDSSEGLTQFTPQLPILLGEATSNGLDYRIAVTTDNICSEHNEMGYFEPCDHCMVNQGPNNAIYVTPGSQPSPTAVLTQLVDAVWNWSAGNGDSTEPYSPCNYDQEEQFFEVPFLAFDSGLLAGHNSGLLRKNAYLGMLTFNGDGEDDVSPLTVDDVLKFVQALKPDPSMITWSYIGENLEDSTSKFALLANSTNGISIDLTSIHSGVQLANYFSSTIDLGVFRLGSQPLVSSLQVNVDGVPVALDSDGELNWSYDPIRNAVVFNPSNIPIPGSTVTVDYNLGCQ